MPMRITASLVLLMLAGTSLGGCLPTTTEAAFVGSRELHLCEGAKFPVCRQRFASCKLEPDQYLEGRFPGSIRFLVETPAGDWRIRVSLFLADQRAPGEQTEITWYEPGCSEPKRFVFEDEHPNGNLFSVAGRDQVFDVAQSVAESGDHLIELFSDATVDYTLRADVEPN